MATRIQITIDCADPGLLVRFWAQAVGYVVPPAPDGFVTWTDWYRHIGVPEDELGDGGDDRLIDPDGVGPALWFQPVPEAKTVKNRIHLDLDVGGGRQTPLPPRRARVESAASRLVQAGAARLRTLDGEAEGHFGIVLADPEGNEFCLH
jgi:hypothetical protein